MNTASLNQQLVVMTVPQMRKLINEEVKDAFEKLNIDTTKTEQGLFNQKQAAKYLNVSITNFKYLVEIGMVKTYPFPAPSGTNIKRYKKTQLDEAVKSSEIQRYKYKTA